MIFYTLNFDFTHERAQIISPIPPVPYREGGLSCESPFIPEELGKTLFLPNACALEPYVFGTFLEAERKALFSEEAKTVALKLLLIKIARMRDFCPSSLAQRIKSAVISDVRKNNVEIAHSLGYHPYYVNEVFSRAEGVSLHKFIMRERLIKARELITTTDRALEDIAADCGFSSPSHLSASVRREYGITPSKMRKI
jgi:AraC-like DNA-binding protein